MSRCSVKTTSFWFGDGFGLDGAGTSESYGAEATENALAIAVGVKISPNSVASSRHFLS